MSGEFEAEESHIKIEHKTLGEKSPRPFIISPRHKNKVKRARPLSMKLNHKTDIYADDTEDDSPVKVARSVSFFKEHSSSSDDGKKKGRSMKNSISLMKVISLKSPKVNDNNNNETLPSVIRETQPLSPSRSPIKHATIAPDTKSPPKKGKRREHTEMRRRCSSLDVDTSKLQGRSITEKFVVNLPQSQQHSFYYNPEQTLSQMIDKIISIRSGSGLTIETHSVTDAKGNVLDLTLTAKDVKEKEIFFLKKDDSNDVVVTADGRIVPRNRALKIRSDEEIKEMNALCTEDMKPLSQSFRKTPIKKKKAFKTCAIDSPILNHARNYPSSNLKIKTERFGATIVAGTIDVLVEILTHEMGRDKDFEKSFVVCYDGFITPRLLFEKIKLRWEKNSVDVRESIIEFLKVWLNRRIDAIADDIALKFDFCKWVKNIDDKGLDEVKATSFKLFVNAQLEGKRTSYLQEIEQMLQDEDLECAPEPFFSNESIENPDIFDFHPTEIARQLTLVDADYLKKVKPHEWLQQRWMKGKAPNITAIINRFNMMSNWVSTVVVLGKSTEVRAMAINRFILVAMECLVLRNYNAVLEIVSGLTTSSVTRMVQTWQKLEQTTWRNLERLKEFVSMDNKFRTLREAQESTEEEPCIPYIGVYLGYLTLIEDGNPDFTEDELVNFEKFSMVAEIILRFEGFRSHLRYKLQPVETIQQYLQNPLVLSEVEIEKESLEREGREENAKIKAKLGKKAKFVN